MVGGDILWDIDGLGMSDHGNVCAWRRKLWGEILLYSDFTRAKVGGGLFNRLVVKIVIHLQSS